MSLVRRFGPRPDAPELLALRALKLGDLLVAVPAVRALRRAHPEHELVLAVPEWLEPVVALVGGVDVLLPTRGLDDPLPVEPGRVDVAVNLHGSGPESRGLIALLEARREIVHHVDGWEGGTPWVHGVLERVRWTRLLADHGIPADPDDVGLLVPPVEPVARGAAVVHVGAFYGSRQWPVDRFARVARALADEGREVLLTGSAAEGPRALEVAALAGLPQAAVVAGELGLTEFAALVAAASLVVSADTGAAHLASAYGIPSVVLFGPAPPEEWGPPPGPHVVLTDASVRRGETFAPDPDPALLAVTVDDVLAAVRSLDGVAPRPPAVDLAPAAPGAAVPAP
ncbi:glycosyltransferase family 9 protein [Cellulomonas sp. JZ18]|uniref:glycosyltransferase family 9 protein n=1 Tax=Cellulomonas sp. JZ18 TaxID=2654191 RepID=UPI0012D4742A|nr:glycosyltransferase family 9 protein [Cellulomonas sp. JZ18]QGQ20454.1 glycosyltransferase family 9 protein [Cellulomonas sp. JZ18]